jgi:hypothetical protein
MHYACTMTFSSLISVCAAIALLGAMPLSMLALPDARITPGAIGASDSVSVSATQVCVRGYARAARHPYDAEWRHYRTAVFRAYGIPHDHWRNFAVDQTWSLLKSAGARSALS